MAQRTTILPTETPAPPRSADDTHRSAVLAVLCLGPLIGGMNLAVLVGAGTAAAGAVVVLLLLPNRSRSLRRSS